MTQVAAEDERLCVKEEDGKANSYEANIQAIDAKTAELGAEIQALDQTMEAESKQSSWLAEHETRQWRLAESELDWARSGIDGIP